MLCCFGAALAQPSITGVSPNHGNIGSTVTLSGSNFNPSAANNIVIFGTTLATVTSASSNSLTVTVPMGAKYGSITVLNTANGLSASSSIYFTPIYTPNKGGNVSTSDFAAKQDYYAYSISKCAKLGDMNGDGKPDLVYTNQVFGNALNVLENTSTTGNISFGSTYFFAGANVMNDFTLCDLDGDGKLDIAIASDDNTLRFLRNTSTGSTFSFANQVSINSGSHPYSITAADIDSDGKPEIVATDYGGQVKIYQNYCSPGILTASSIIVIASLNTGAFPREVCLADVDGDNKKDILCVSEDLTMTVWKNNTSPGNITNFYYNYGGTFTLGAKPNSLIMADLDGDGKLDAISGSNNIGYLSLLRNTSTLGSFSFENYVALNSPVGPKPVVSDINGDGKADIVMSDSYFGKISVYSNNSTPGSFSSGNFVRSEIPTAPGPESTIAGDVDGDGKPEIMSGNPLGPSISVLQNITQALPAPRNALSFDGNNDYVELPANLSTSLTQPSTQAITIEYWFKGSSLHSAVRFQDGGYIIAGYNNMHVISTDGGLNGISIGNNATDGKWHHIAMTWQRNTTNGFKSYVDGKLVDQRNAADVALPVITSPSYIGSFNGSLEFMNGTIDEVRIYNTALNQASIQADMKSTSIAMPSNLLAYYHFDHGISSFNNVGVQQLIDQSSNGHHATLNNFSLLANQSNWVESYAMVVPQIAPASGIQSSNFFANWSAPITGIAENYFLDVATDSTFTTFVSGYNGLNVNGTSALVVGLTPNTTYYYRVRANKSSVNQQGCTSDFVSVTTTNTLSAPGNALNFDGQNDYVALPSGLINAVSAGNALTIEFYFKGSEFQNAVRFEIQYLANVIIAGLGSQGNYTHFIGYISNGILSAGSNITDGNWHHIALTFQQGQTNGFKSYLDGNLVAQTNAVNFMPNFQGMGAFLGSRYGNSEFMNGSMDELRFYNKALSQAEIQADMVSTSSAAPGNLLAYYNFDHGIANANNSGIVALLDQTANNYHMTLGNFGLNGTTSNWVESYAMVVPTATAATNVAGSGFTANWIAPIQGAVSSYIVDICKDSSFTQPIAGSPFTVNGLTYTLSGFQLDTFYYRVRAQKTNVSGMSVASNTISVIAGTPPPNAPVSSGIVYACDNSTIPPLTVSVGSGVTVDWYTTATGGTPVFTNSPTFQTNQTAAGVYIYYAEARDLSTGYVSTTRTATRLEIKQTHFYHTAAACDNYVWNNTTYTASGVYTSTQISSKGCDSIVELALTIEPISTPLVSGSTSICAGGYTNLTTNHPASFSHCWKNTSNSPQWHSSTTGSNNTSFFPSLAMLNDIPYITTFDNSNGNAVKVKKWNGNSWEQVGNSISINPYETRLAFNGSQLYLLVQEYLSFQISVLTLVGNTWQLVGPSNITSGSTNYPNLVCNNGSVYIAFLNSNLGSKASVMRFEDNQWQYVGDTLASIGISPYLCLAFDGTTPYIAFQDFSSSNRVTVRKLVGSSWVTAGNSGFSDGSSSFVHLAIDNGTPYVVYRDQFYGQKTCVKKFTNGTWNYVGSPGFSTGNTLNHKITFYNHIPYIAFTEVTVSNKCSVKYFDGSNWVYYGNPTFTPGNTASLNLNMSAGYPQMVVLDVLNGGKTMYYEHSIPCESNQSIFSTNLTGNYNVTVTNDIGCSAVSSPISVTTQNCNAASVKLFIQGYYSGNNTMTSVLMNQGVGTNSSVTDSVIVELHQNTTPYALVASSNSVVYSNGNIVANFNSGTTGTYYIVIRSRNGLKTWSANPVAIPSVTMYDFTTAAAMAYGNNQIEVTPGVWALHSGDINQDLAIDIFDYLQLDPDIVQGESGYLNTDINGDGVVDAFDYLVIEQNIISGINAFEPQ